MLEKSQDYKVFIDENEIEVRNIRVSAYPINQIYKGYQRPIEQTEIAGLASFDFDKKVYVTVKSSKKIEIVRIRPEKYGIKPEIIDQNTVGFYVDKSILCSVEINDYHSCLHLFANEKREIPTDCIYYGKGVHNVGVLKLESNSRVYIEDGAIIYGRIEAADAENISIEGYGIICGSKNEERTTFTKFIRCKNVHIEGVILCDACEWCTMFALCTDVTVKNVKLVGMWRYNADGFDIVNSQNVSIKDCYIRTFDDCIAIKGASGFGDENVSDVEVSGCVAWCDWGRAFEIGAETCAKKITNITFRDCVVVRTQDVALDIQHTDYAEISNVVFENIIVEHNDKIHRPKLQEYDGEIYAVNNDENYYPSLIVLEIKKNMWTTSKDYGTISDITFKNIKAPGTMGISLLGANEEYKISGVSFENISSYGGKHSYYMKNVENISIG